MPWGASDVRTRRLRGIALFLYQEKVWVTAQVLGIDGGLDPGHVGREGSAHAVLARFVCGAN